MIWYNELNDGIVISTRVRLARNIDKTPFPATLGKDDKKKVTQTICDSILKSNSTLSKDFKLYKLNEMTESEKTAMTEEHLISPQMINNPDGAVLVNNDKTMSIMLMEEDHIRLQIIKGGYCLEEAYDLADKVDDVMEESLSYAFNEKFGYLTACPTNAGTGMRASVMMHLPALVMTGNISRVVQSFSGMGIAVRGLYGEGTDAEGALYQISNSITMGLSERETIEKLKSVTDKICDMEKQARDMLLKNHSDDLKDKLMRSYGILKYAVKITSKEAKTMLSDVMLGQNMGIIKCDGKMTPLELMIKTAPSVISGNGGLSPNERDKKRAELIKENL
ncbi:MAG: protein arginine kinase [Clostridiales bacterium]|nr:protein arginine kinase [Clostridiales bacterium]